MLRLFFPPHVWSAVVVPFFNLVTTVFHPLGVVDQPPYLNWLGNFLRRSSHFSFYSPAVLEGSYSFIWNGLYEDPYCMYPIPVPKVLLLWEYFRGALNPLLPIQYSVFIFSFYIYYNIFYCLLSRAFFRLWLSFFRR